MNHPASCKGRSMSLPQDLAWTRSRCSQPPDDTRSGRQETGCARMLGKKGGRGTVPASPSAWIEPMERGRCAGIVETRWGRTGTRITNPCQPSARTGTRSSLSWLHAIGRAFNTEGSLRIEQNRTQGPIAQYSQRHPRVPVSTTTAPRGLGRASTTVPERDVANRASPK